MARNAVAKAGKTELDANVAYDYGDEAGSGFENVGRDEMMIPFLTVLQSNSPQVESNNPKGSKPGMLFNTVTQELLSGERGVVLTPVHHDHLMVEWVPRAQGGGLVGMHSMDSEVVAKARTAADNRRVGKLFTENKNELVETFYVYCLTLDDAGTEVTGFAALALSSTKIKVWRQWITAMRLVKGRPPIFANRDRLTTIKQKNEYGTFFNFVVSPLRENRVASLVNPVSEAPLLQAAREFREMVQSGLARADFSTQTVAGEESEAGMGASDEDPGPAPF